MRTQALFRDVYAMPKRNNNADRTKVKCLERHPVPRKLQRIWMC